LLSGNYYGSSLSLGDIDGDGFTDLLLGSPYMNTSIGIQSGSLSAFKSSKDMTTGTVLSQQDATFNLLGDDMIQWFGSSSRVQNTDAGRLLLVGAPEFNHHNNASLGKLFAFNITDLNNIETYFKINGTMVFDKFGWSFDFGNPYASSSALSDSLFLAASIPTRSVADPQDQAGVVRLLMVDSSLAGDHTIDDFTPVVDFVSDEPYSRLGYELMFNDFNGDSIDDLVLSQPWKNTAESGQEQSGRVLVYLGGSHFQKGKVIDLSGSSSLCLQATSLYSLFGSRVRSLNYLSLGENFRPDLLVSSPTTSSLGAQQAGSVTLFLSPPLSS